MPVDEGHVGAKGELTVEVEPSLSADAYGNAGLPALATPALVGLFERASMRALDGIMGEGERSVGSVVDIKHLAPTPLGAEVVVEATIASIAGREVWFELTARDPGGEIASGRHARFVVDDARFQAKLGGKGRVA